MSHTKESSRDYVWEIVESVMPLADDPKDRTEAENQFWDNVQALIEAPNLRVMQIWEIGRLIDQAYRKGRKDQKAETEED